MGKRGGKGSRARSKERRARERRARKASMNAQYQAWAEKGINQKSKRAQNNARKSRGVGARTPAPLPAYSVPHLARMKLLALAGYANQWSSRYGALISAHIRSNWSSLEEAWEAHGITPLRTDIPIAYLPENWQQEALNG